MNQAHDFLPETETTVPIIRTPGDGKVVRCFAIKAPLRC